MEYRVDINDGQAIVYLTGEIDLDKSPAARAALLHCVTQHSAVHVDMSAVDYIDSSGVASLVEALQKARSRKVEFHLRQVSPATLKVLALARLDRVFSILD